MENKPNDRNLDDFLAHIRLKNLPQRTQCDCIFPPEHGNKPNCMGSDHLPYFILALA